MTKGFSSKTTEDYNHNVKVDINTQTEKANKFLQFKYNYILTIQKENEQSK